MNIPNSKIAVTLYDLRDHCKSESDLDATLDKVRAMGYECVQVSGVSLPAATIRKYLDKYKLYCCATHENLAAISGDSAPLIDRLQTLCCDFTALGHPGEYDYRSLDAVKNLAAIFNRTSAALAPKGIKLGYHNHSAEFTKIAGSKKTMLETFYDLTDNCVCAELDVHWVARGGGSPAAWIRKLAGRIPVIHFKDFVIYNNEPFFCEIGEGNLDWPEIIRACEETGVRWYSIEQDIEFPGRDIFTSIKLSIDNLHAMGVR